MRNNPYVGPRPYERGDRHNFYGRDREARELRALIVAEREVLFYAQSGAGKTSLLNARVIPALEEKGFYVLPVVRVGSELPPEVEPQAVDNIFVFSALLSLTGEDANPQTLLPHTLRSFLEESYPEPEDEFEIQPLVLIFDQFEELFTAHRDRWQETRGFFLQVREALDALPRLGVVFAMREDHVAGVDPYIPLFPRRLRARFRMERLGSKGALAAVAKPASNAGCPFDPGVAERLVDDLRRIKTHRAPHPHTPTPLHSHTPTPPHSILGPFVEPVQLQVVCNRLWANLPDQEDKAIQWEEVEQYGNIDRALTDFYESALDAAMRETDVSERKLRRWFGQQLITPVGTRGLAMRGSEETAGLPNAAVDVLEGRHLIRADVRAGARWYELAHDRLVDPILQSNQAWEAARETPLRTAARHWQETGDVSLIYWGAALKEALAWAESHPAKVEPEEQSFLEASQHAEATRKRRRSLAILGSLAALAVIVLVSFLAWTAYQSSRLARSRELVATSMLWRSINQEQSILLARMAVEVADTPATEIALRQALVNFYPSEVLEEAGGPSVYSVAYSPDGHFLAVGLSTGHIRIWDTETRELSFTLGGPDTGGVWALAYSPDGRSLASGGTDSRIYIWDLETGTETALTGHTGNVYTVDYSPDGRYLVSGGYDKTVRVWDLETGVPITLTGHTASIYGVAYSPDGNWVASAGTSDRTVRVWELLQNPHGRLKVGEVFTLTGHTAAVNSVAFSPSENLLASGSSDKTIRVWDLTTREETLTLVGHAALVRSVAFSGDGHYLISAGRDATVRLWDVGRRKSEAVAVLTGGTAAVINDLALGPGGRFLASASGDGEVRIWDAQPPQRVMLTTLMPDAGYARHLDFSPDGHFLVAGSTDSLAYVWSLETGELVARLQHGTWNDVWGVAYSPAGDRLVTGARDDVARIWDPSTGSLMQSLEGHTGDVTAMAYGPDGRYVATASKDRTARIWDTTTGETVQVLEGHTAPLYGIAYSPDGRFVATASDDNDVRLWEVRTDGGGISYTSVLTLSGHARYVYSVAFSPDGKVLASGSWDRTAHLWELCEDLDGTLSVGRVTTLSGHTGYVYDVAFSPNGRYLATTSWDKTVRLWDLSRSPPETIAILPGHTGRILGVAFSPDGKVLASASADGTIRRYMVNFADVLALSWEYVPRTMTIEERLMLLGETP
jgi:WD40 repeat protein